MYCVPRGAKNISSVVEFDVLKSFLDDAKIKLKGIVKIWGYTSFLSYFVKK